MKELENLKPEEYFIILKNYLKFQEESANEQAVSNFQQILLKVRIKKIYQDKINMCY